jgi:hypothetical protein
LRRRANGLGAARALGVCLAALALTVPPPFARCAMIDLTDDGARICVPEPGLAVATADVAELAPQPSPFPDPLIALTHLIREGLMDGQDELHRRLLRLAVTRTAVTKPKMLTSEEKAMAGLSEALP